MTFVCKIALRNKMEPNVLFLYRLTLQMTVSVKND